VSSEQGRYQVRFDWGAPGAAAVGGDAHVIVWADALGEDPVPLQDLPGAAAVVRATLPTAKAVADWVMALQLALKARLAIAVIAAGSHRTDGSWRTAVEDLLAAGAVIDALGALGLDATSPEAAAAEAAYSGLRGATGHLITAAVTASELADRPSPAQGRVDPALGVEDVQVLRRHPDAD